MEPVKGTGGKAGHGTKKNDEASKQKEGYTNVPIGQFNKNIVNNRISTWIMNDWRILLSKKSNPKLPFRKRSIKPEISWRTCFAKISYRGREMYCV